MEWKDIWKKVLVSIIVAFILFVATGAGTLTYFYWKSSIKMEIHQERMDELKANDEEIKKLVIGLRLQFAAHSAKMEGGDERDQRRAMDTERALIFEEDMEKEGVERDMADGVIVFDNH
ncbi:MAG: hypothetical protein H8E51_08570 [Bacteroidetes bacterium]|nr:hypothetical protein [Bacteroidota bacterium]